MVGTELVEQYFFLFASALDRRSLPSSSTAQNIQNDILRLCAPAIIWEEEKHVWSRSLDTATPPWVAPVNDKEMPLRYQLLNLQEKPNVIYCHCCRRSHKKIKGSIFVGCVSLSLMARECRGGFCAPIQFNYFGLSVAFNFKKLQRAGRLDWYI